MIDRRSEQRVQCAECGYEIKDATLELLKDKFAAVDGINGICRSCGEGMLLLIMTRNTGTITRGMLRTRGKETTNETR